MHKIYALFLPLSLNPLLMIPSRATAVQFVSHHGVCEYSVIQRRRNQGRRKEGQNNNPIKIRTTALFCSQQMASRIGGGRGENCRRRGRWIYGALSRPTVVATSSLVASDGLSSQVVSCFPEVGNEWS
jgi:hypothetical protein